MSRSVRVVDDPAIWPTVDEWAATVAGDHPVVAWARTRCRLVREDGPYLDVLRRPPDLDARPLGSPVVAAKGPVAYPVEPQVADALTEAGIPFRLVTEARRYAWRGPAFGSVLLEVHTTPETGTVEAWWENVWAAWPTLKVDESGRRQAPARRLTAVAQIDRLLADLGLPPLSRRR